MQFELFILILIAFTAFWARDLFSRLNDSYYEMAAAWEKAKKRLQKRDEAAVKFIELICPEEKKKEAIHKAAAKADAERNKAPIEGKPIHVFEAEELLKKKMEELYREAKQSSSPPSGEEVGALRTELASKELELSEAVEEYEELASQYNALQKRFPGSLLAPLFGHKPAGLQKK